MLDKNNNLTPETYDISTVGLFGCAQSLRSNLRTIMGCQILFILVTIFTACFGFNWLSDYGHFYPGLDTGYSVIFCTLWTACTACLTVALHRPGRRASFLLPNLVVQTLQLFASLCNCFLEIYLVWNFWTAAKSSDFTPEQYAVQRRMTCSEYGFKLYLNLLIIGFSVSAFRIILAAYFAPSNASRVTLENRLVDGTRHVTKPEMDPSPPPPPPETVLAGVILNRGLISNDDHVTVDIVYF